MVLNVHKLYGIEKQCRVTNYHNKTSKLLKNTAFRLFNFAYLISFPFTALLIAGIMAARIASMAIIFQVVRNAIRNPRRSGIHMAGTLEMHQVERRQAIVEHPYGTLKRPWGFNYRNGPFKNKNQFCNDN